MSSEPAITLEGAGKAYALFSKPEDRLKQMLLGRHRTYYKEFWALQPTDLEIGPGETWGIIGRNGSGKSTMLQMICGNLAPTTGRITVRGKVAALLELGAGFNPEFTGRENVYINGALAGYEPGEIDDRMDAILGFADIGPFINQPVKTYSSGMFARLAFAVAINVEPDILVVDETLSVGDEAFQRKCFARMEQIKSNGATILFVSHSSNSILELCDHAVLLDDGRKITSGRPHRVVFLYNKIASSTETKRHTILEEAINSTDDNSPNSESEIFQDLREENDNYYGTENEDLSREYFDDALKPDPLQYDAQGVEIITTQLVNEAGKNVNVIRRGDKYTVILNITITEPIKLLRTYMTIKTKTGITVTGCCFPQYQKKMMAVQSNDSFKFEFKFSCRINPGVYFINFALQGPELEIFNRSVGAIIFRVVAKDEKNIATGIFDLGYEAECTHLKDTKREAGEARP